MIDTATVQGRRALRFTTLYDMLADARALARAEQADPPRLRRHGNWTLGQALNHIAAWIEYPLVGYPAALVIPDDWSSAARAAKARLLTAPMSPGERLPVEGLTAGTLAVEIVPTAAGLARLESAAAMLSSGRRTNTPPSPTPPSDPSPATTGPSCPSATPNCT